MTGVSRTQTVTTTGGGTLGTTTRTITTEIAYAGSDASTVTDAHQQAQGSPARTSFTAESSTVLRVDRPTTTTRYGQVAAADAYGRIASVWRVLDGSTTFETRTTWDATYPIEPATVTDNYGALGGAPARTTTYTYQASSLGLVSRIVEPLTATDDRWTDFVYNTNSDVVLETVSAEGSATDRTVTKSCYTTQSNSCSDASPGLTLVRRIDRWVSGGASDEDTNVVTDFAYDAYGQRTSSTRANRNGAGVLIDARVDTAAFDDKGSLTSEIVNRVDGVVSPASYDTEPDPATGARTDLTTTHAYDTAGNRVSTADPRRAIALAATTYARDAFGRSVTDGWGTADTGGSWSGTTVDHDVTGSIGTIALSSITNRNAYLTSVSAADAEVLVKVRVDTLAAGADHLFWVYLRRQDSSNYYQARLSFDIDHTVKAYFSRTAAGTTTVIDAGTSSVGHTTADWYWMRARVSGTTSVTGKIRVWRDGSAEPAGWLVDGTDASAPAALQGSGHTGIRFQLGSGYSGGFPVTASVDDFALTSIGGGGQTVTVDDFVSRTTYDPLDQPVSTSTPTTTGIAGSATTSTTVYDELGGVRLMTDEAARVTATVFDRDGRARETWDDPAPTGGASQSSAMTFDADGRPLTSMDQRQLAAPSFNLGWTALSYDGLGRQTSVVEAQSSSPDVATETRTTYDGLDRATTSEVGYGSPASQKTDTAFDLGGRATSVDDGFTCAVSTFAYRDLSLTRQDSLDTATCAANTGSRTVTSTYDALGRLTQSEITAGPGTGDRPTIASYDAVGNVLTSAVRTAGTTSTTTLTLNRLDQVLAQARPDGSTAKTTYDPVGNPLDACTWASGTAGACLAVGSDGWTNPPTNSTSTRWDARNGRIALTDAASNRTTLYDPAHGYAVSAVYLPTITDQTREHQVLYTYDSEHRLTGITQQLCTISSGHACSSTTATGSDTYAYDDADNRTQVVENNGATSADYRYCHDALGQLTARRTGAACTSSPDETNTFDDAGNRTQAIAGGTTTNFAYTAAGVLCDLETGAAASCMGGNVGVDDAGRLSSCASYTYLYDAEGRLVSACNDADCIGTGFRRIDFVYDGAGHRTKITETPAVGSAVVTTFRYAGDSIVAESKDGVLVREYTVDEGGTISKITIPAGQTAAGTYLVTWNGHGDALALYRIETSGALTLANSYTYSTWGLPATATHNSIPDLGFRFLYVGAADVQWDGTYGLPLTYMHARHYSPTLGRFLQPDPSRLDAQIFVYGENGPVTKSDPDGLMTLRGPGGQVFSGLSRIFKPGGNWVGEPGRGTYVRVVTSATDVRRLAAKVRAFFRAHPELLRREIYEPPGKAGTWVVPLKPKGEVVYRLKSGSNGVTIEIQNIKDLKIKVHVDDGKN